MSDNENLDAILEQARTGKAAPPPSPGKPSGGRAALLIGVVVLVAVVGVIPFFLLGAGGGMKNTEPAQIAIEKATNDARVIEALGEPVEVKGLINGEYSTGGLSGEANFAFRIQGSKDKGRLYLDARRVNGVWEFFTLAVEVNSTGEIITLNE